MIISIRTLNGFESGPALIVIARIPVLSPLQGFFNIIMFIHPEVLTHEHSKKSNEKEASALVSSLRTSAVTTRQGSSMYAFQIRPLQNMKKRNGRLLQASQSNSSLTTHQSSPRYSSTLLHRSGGHVEIQLALRLIPIVILLVEVCCSSPLNRLPAGGS